MNNMKTIKIKKSYDFSPNSKIYLHIGSRKVNIKGFGLFSLPVEPGEEFFASHLWTRSNKIPFEQLTNNSNYLIKPRMGKVLAFTSLIILMVCFCIFIFTKSRWSFLPLLPLAIYVGSFLTVLRNRYLIIEKDI
jgi:hypothetical protein